MLSRRAWTHCTTSGMALWTALTVAQLLVPRRCTRNIHGRPAGQQALHLTVSCTCCEEASAARKAMSVPENGCKQVHVRVTISCSEVQICVCVP
jgi:hypothetical protein